MRGVLRNLAATAVAGLAWAGLSGSPAMAYEDSEPAVWSGATGLDASASVLTAEELEITVSVSGSYLAIHETVGLGGPAIGNPDILTFTPQLAVDSGWLGLSVKDDYCAEGTTCDRGTLTVGFDRPVLDPVVHLSGLGSLIDDAPAGSSEYALTGSTPPGAALGEPAPGASNLTVTDNLIQAADPTTSPATCAAGAGCGSVPVTGVVTELTFDVALLNLLTGPGDGVSLQVTAQELVLPEVPEEPELPNTGVPTLGLVGLGAAGVALGGALLGGALFGGVRAGSRRLRWRGMRRA